MPKVVPLLDFDGVDDGVFLLGCIGVDVAVKSSAFLLFVVWLSKASSIRGLRYCNVYGMLSAMRMDFCEASCATWSECLSNDTWMKLRPCFGETFSSWASISLYSLIWDFLLSQINIWITTTWSNVWVVLPKPSSYEFLIGFFDMNTRAKVFASYNILQYLCDFYPCSYSCNCLKMPKKSQINEYSDPCLGPHPRQTRVDGSCVLR